MVGTIKRLILRLLLVYFICCGLLTPKPVYCNLANTEQLIVELSPDTLYAGQLLKATITTSENSKLSDVRVSIGEEYLKDNTLTKYSDNEWRINRVIYTAGDRLITVTAKSSLGNELVWKSNIKIEDYDPDMSSWNMTYEKGDPFFTVSSGQILNISRYMIRVLDYEDNELYNSSDLKLIGVNFDENKGIYTRTFNCITDLMLVEGASYAIQILDMGKLTTRYLGHIQVSAIEAPNQPSEPTEPPLEIITLDQNNQDFFKFSANESITVTFDTSAPLKEGYWGVFEISDDPEVVSDSAVNSKFQPYYITYKELVEGSERTYSQSFKLNELGLPDERGVLESGKTYYFRIGIGSPASELPIYTETFTVKIPVAVVIKNGHSIKWNGSNLTVYLELDKKLPDDTYKLYLQKEIDNDIFEGIQITSMPWDDGKKYSQSFTLTQLSNLFSDIEYNTSHNFRIAVSNRVDQYVQNLDLLEYFDFTGYSEIKLYYAAPKKEAPTPAPTPTLTPAPTLAPTPEPSPNTITGVRSNQ